MSYQIHSLQERPDLHKAFDIIGDRVWPQFMGWDIVLRQHWDKLYKTFPEYQLVLCENDEAIGLANSIPFFRDMPLEELPEEGWDWVLVKGLKDSEKGLKPNTLSGLQVAIDRQYQGKGISPLMVLAMCSLAREKGCRHLAIPVRPTRKSDYPETPISEYIGWKGEDGLPFDPWMRVHVKLGARIIKPCHRSMYITGSIADWEQWTGMKFPKTGVYNVEGALTPVRIDQEKDTGEYIEPNVWIVHEIPPGEREYRAAAP